MCIINIYTLLQLKLPGGRHRAAPGPGHPAALLDDAAGRLPRGYGHPL